MWYGVNELPAPVIKFESSLITIPLISPEIIQELRDQGLIFKILENDDR